jgi:hypothetical protein
MLNKKIEQFIQTTGEGVVLDYINGQYILENKNFFEGKRSIIGKVQGLGSTIELCIDNFIFSWEKKIISDKSHFNDDDDIELYRSHSSY